MDKKTNNKSKRGLKIVIVIVALLIAVMAGTTIVANIAVATVSKNCCYSSVETIPHRRVGLVLGTSKSLKNGTPNLYFKYRIEAAAALYHSGKINKILVSGDNSVKSYDEPSDMRDALMALGVPGSAIHLDYAGFSTFDSMVRAKKVFGLKKLTVISQRWHNERAIYIAQKNGMDVIGFNAKDVQLRKISVKNRIREFLARTKMAFDIFFGKEPHFLGDPIEI